MVCKKYQEKINKIGDLVAIKLPASIAISTALMALPPYGREGEGRGECRCVFFVKKYNQVF